MNLFNTLIKPLLVSALVLTFATFPGRANAQVIKFGRSFDDSYYITRSALYIAFWGGKRFSSLSEVRQTLGTTLSNPATYNFRDLPLRETVFGFGLHYGLQDTEFFLTFEGDYSVPNLAEDRLSRSQGLYDDIADLEYAINFPHQRLNLRPMIGVHLFSFLSIQGGFEWSINTTPNDITYNSNDLTVGRDLAIETELENYLIGRNSLNLVGRVELSWPLQNGRKSDDPWFVPFVNGTFHYGQSDVLRTLANNYRLQERGNRLNSISLTAGVRMLIYYPE